jgi:hypothetical protein
MNNQITAYNFLLQNIDLQTNKKQLEILLTRSITYNISQLTKPCFQPAMKSLFHQIIYLLKVKKTDINKYTKMFWKGQSERNFDIYVDPISNFYIFLMSYFIKTNQKKLFKYMMNFYVLRQYSGLFSKSFSKYCVDSYFLKAFENLNKTHLFIREKTIGNALYYISLMLIRKFEKDIQKLNPKMISYFISDSRTRISQSLKSFAEAYYKISEKGGGIKIGSEDFIGDDEDDKPISVSIFEQEKTKKLAEFISKNITVYKEVNPKAFTLALKNSKVQYQNGKKIIKQLLNLKYTENIELIIILYLKSLKETNELCGNNFNKKVRDLIRIKRSKNEIYFKSEIIKLIQLLVNDYDDDIKYDDLKERMQYNYKLFLAFYLTLCVRFKICGLIKNNIKRK